MCLRLSYCIHYKVSLTMWKVWYRTDDRINIRDLLREGVWSFSSSNCVSLGCNKLVLEHSTTHLLSLPCLICKMRWMDQILSKVTSRSPVLLCCKWNPRCANIVSLWIKLTLIRKVGICHLLLGKIPLNFVIGFST